jgi:hypothetical protein
VIYSKFAVLAIATIAAAVSATPAFPQQAPDAAPTPAAAAATGQSSEAVEAVALITKATAPHLGGHHRLGNSIASSAKEGRQIWLFRGGNQRQARVLQGRRSAGYTL